MSQDATPETRNEVGFWKLAVFLNALTPLALLGYDAYLGALGTNPIEFFLRTTGVLTLIFLLLTLAVTPLRKLLKVNELIKVRRMLGLFAFFYAAVHLVTYSIFDKGLVIADMVSDVAKRPFIAVGMTAFALLAPLAVTSTNGWVKRLGGRRWALLHKLTYLIASLGVIHFWMIQKSDFFRPGLFGAVFLILILFRAGKALRVQGRGAESALRK